MFKHRNVKKIEYLYDKYKNLLFNEAYKILQDKYLSEDAVQQSFIKIIDNIEKIDDCDSNKTRNFLVIICRNTSINIYNTNKKIVTMEMDEFDYTLCDNISEIIINNDSVNRIIKAIDQLPTKYKDVLVLEKIFGCSKEEISHLLNISMENMYKRSQRARKLLLNELEINGVINDEK